MSLSAYSSSRSAGVSGYDPYTDSGAVLYYDWRRTDLVTYAANLVSQIAPAVGTGNVTQATDANKPGFIPPAPFTFDGTADYLELAACPMPTGTASWYFAAVFQQDALVADTGPRTIAAWGGASDNTAIQVYRIVSGGVNRASVEIGTSVSRVAVTDTSVDLSGVHYLECWYDGTSGYISVDGGAATSALVAQNVAVARTRLGARGPNTVSRFWLGEGGLWLWRDSVPDAELRLQIEEYLALAAGSF